MAIKVIHFIVNSQIRGAERQIINLIKASSLEDSIQHQVLSVYPQGPLHTEIRALKRPAASLGTKHNWLKAFFRLMFYLRKEQPQVLHIYGLKAELIGRLAARLTRIPVVFSAIRSVYTKRSAVAFFLDRLTSRWVTLYVSNSVAGANYHQKRLKHKAQHKFVTVHNGVDTDYLKAYPRRGLQRRRFNIPDEAIVLTMTAELNPDKDQALLIKALAELLPVHPNIYLILAGKDRYGGYLQRLTRDLKITRRVIFPNYLNNIQELLNETDIFVFPSRWEGLPTAILEAMAMSVPVIASAVGGIPELIEDQQTGYLLQPGETNSWQQAIVKLITSRELRESFGRAGRRRAEKQFSLDSLKSKLNGLYKQYAQTKT